MNDVLADVNYRFEFGRGVLAQLEMQARRRLYKKRPELWAKDILGITLWSRQVEVARSVVDHHNTMVAACHASGKSFLTAVLICWWIDTRTLGNARVLSTAPTTAQVRGIVWREVQKMHKLSRQRHEEYLEAVRTGQSTRGLPDHSLPGYVTSSATWKTNDGIELGAGRTPPRGREGDAFQGVHAAVGVEGDGGVLAVIDEGVGVSADMIGTMNNNATGDNDRVLMIANPTNPLSEMGQIWNDPIRCKSWNRISISLFDTPRFTEEHKDLPDEVVNSLVGESYLDRMKRDYGEDSANFISRVLGRWALDSGYILFPQEVIQTGLDTVVIPDADDPTWVGFDVARSEKGDYSYLYTCRPGWVYRTREWRDGPDGFDWYELSEPVKTDLRGIKIRYMDRWRGLPFFPIHNENGQRTTSHAANERTHAHMLESGATQLRIDADGMGALMVDAMQDVTHGEYDIIRMVGGDSSSDRNAWYNQRAEWYTNLADRMRRGEVDIEADTDEAPLGKQLMGIEYKFAAGYASSLLLLSKKELRDKGLKSPDAADAAIYASGRIDESSLGGLMIGDRFEVDLDLYSDSLYAGNNAFFG